MTTQTVTSAADPGLPNVSDLAREARRIEAILVALDGLFMDADEPLTAAANTITHELTERMEKLADQIERIR